MRSFALQFKRDSNHRINNLTNQSKNATLHLMASVLGHSLYFQKIKINLFTSLETILNMQLF